MSIREKIKNLKPYKSRDETEATKSNLSLDRKKVLSAGAVLVAGGLLTAGVIGSNTNTFDNKFVSNNTLNRKVTNENYDYKKADEHYIVKSDKDLSESDGFVKIADGLYTVDKGKKLDSSLEIFEDGEVVVADVEGTEASTESEETTEAVDIAEPDSDSKSENSGEDNKSTEDAESESVEDNENVEGDNDAQLMNVINTNEDEDASAVVGNEDVDTVANDVNIEDLASNDKKEVQNQLSSYINSLPFTKEVKIAVLDTGVSIDDNRVLSGANYSATGSKNDTSDDNGHGSSVTKLILDNTSSLVKIVPIKVIDSTGHGTILSLYQGIEYAIEQKVDIINISLATGAKDTSLITKAIDNAHNAGIKVIAAAGNDDMNVSYFAPANIDSVITVAAVTKDNERALYSNYGNVDYAACGEFERNQGTSFSAAYVTAAVANILSSDKEADIKEIFDEYAYKPDKLDKKYVGNGIISLDEVLTKTEKECIADIMKDFDNWKNLSGEEFDELLYNSDAYKVACFWQHLSDEDKEFAKNLSTSLIKDSTVMTSDGKEMSYIDNLESYDFEEVSVKAFTGNPPSGYFFIKCYKDGTLTDDFRLDVKFTNGSTSDFVQNPLQWTITGYKQTQIARFDTNNLTQNPDNNKWFDHFTVAAFINVPGRYELKCPDVVEDKTLITGKKFESATNAFGVNMIWIDIVHDAGFEVDNKPGTHSTFDFHLNKMPDPEYTVDVNPLIEKENGVKEASGTGAGYTKFDVVINNVKTKSEVNDFYGKVKSNSSFVIQNISCANGFHAENKSYSYTITGNKIGDSAIKAPVILRNIYSVAYDANVPKNDMTEKFEASGTTDTQKNLKYGAENATVNACGYSLPGYKFVGWNTKPDGTGASYQPGNKIDKFATDVTNNTNVHNGTATLYAQWKKNEYTITFDANGGELKGNESITLPYGDTVALADKTKCPEAEKANRVFVGWSTSKDEVKTIISSMRAGFNYANMYEAETKYFNEPKDITLYAVYSIPVSDVESIQLNVWDTDDPDNKNTVSNINFVDAGFKYWNFNTTSKLIQLLESTGASYKATSSSNNLGAAIYATDHAGNTGLIWTVSWNGGSKPLKTPKLNTNYSYRTEHYLYTKENIGKDELAEYYGTTNNDKIVAGKNYVPSYLTAKTTLALPVGYEPARITAQVGNGEVVSVSESASAIKATAITDNTVFKAYYKPKQYKITFKTEKDETYIEGNNTSNPMNIYYKETIEDLPTASKPGNTFVGWYVLDENGNTTNETINVGDKFKYTKDITVVPKWNVNSYKVKYDAVTNGGTMTDKSEEMIKYGTTVDTSKKTATKKGFEFVGWNTKPDATKAGDDAHKLVNGKMPERDVTFYAIYSRTVKADFYSAYVDSATGNIAKSGKLTYTKEVTYYNKATYATITAPKSEHGNLDWTFIGWTTGNNYDSPVTVYANSSIQISENVEFYGLYQRLVTLTYVSNCEATIDPVSDTVYFNAAKEGKQGKVKKNFEGTLDNSLQSNENRSYVGWVQISPNTNCKVCGNPTSESIIGTMDTTKNGCKCKCFYPGSGYKNKRQDGCTCCFLPGEAFSIDRDVTMAARWDARPVISAKDTFISNDEKDDFEKKALDSAHSNDNEDKTTDVIIQNKDEIKEILDSTDENVEVSIIYKTTDSYGNTGTEEKTLHVVNSNAKDAANTSYARFVNKNTGAKSVAYSKGGFEENSLWITKDTYTNTLSDALANAEKVKNVKMSTQNSYVLNNGETYKPQYVLKYTNSDIKNVKAYLKNNGYGKFQNETDSTGSKALNKYKETYIDGYKK